MNGAKIRKREFSHHLPKASSLRSYYTKFSAEDWSGNEYRYHSDELRHPYAAIVGQTLHMLVRGKMSSNTWGIMESSITLDTESGDLILRSGAPYAGEMLVLVATRRGDAGYEAL